MSWHFGGNLEPVLTTCQLNWTDCPLAVAYYIWYEVVTDVIDCLKSETILWTATALLLLCAAVCYSIKWKIRWKKRLNANTENFMQVDSKVRDLELKVNILTYKAQYGTWPLLHVANKDKDKLPNITPLFSQLGDAKSSIKYLLTGIQRKKCNERNLFYNIQSQLSVSDLNPLDFDARCIVSSADDSSKRNTIPNDQRLLQMSPNRGKNNDAFGNVQAERCHEHTNRKNKFTLTKAPENFSTIDNRAATNNNTSIFNNYEDTNSKLGAKENSHDNLDIMVLQSKLDFTKTISTDKKGTVDVDIVQDKLQPSAIVQSDIVPSILEDKILGLNNIDSEEKNRIYETLNQIKVKLENIHLTLQNYCSQNPSNDLEINSKQFNNIIDYLNDNNLYYIEHNSINNYDYLNDIWNRCTYKDVDLKHFVDTHDGSKTTISYPSNTSRTKYLIFNDKKEKGDNIKIKCQQQNKQSDIFLLADKSNDCREDLDESLSEINITAIGSKEANYYNKGMTFLAKNTKKLTSNEVEMNISKSSLMGIPRNGNSDDKLKATLLQEPSKIKNKLLFKIESNSYLEWQNNDYDIIAKESNESCSLNKAGKIPNALRVRKENMDNCQPINYNNDRKELENDENNHSLNKYPTDANALEYDNAKEENINLSNYNSNDSNKTFNETTDNVNSEGSNNKNSLDILEYLLYDESDDTYNDNNEEKNKEDINLTNNLSLTYLMDSSTDISVDKLIDHLIDNERKYKLSNSSSNLNANQKYTVDILNKIISAHNFLECAQLENENVDHFFTELNDYQEEQIIDNNLLINSERRILNEVREIEDIEQRHNDSQCFNNALDLNEINFEVSNVARENNRSNRHCLQDKNFHSQGDFRKHNKLPLNLNFENFEIKDALYDRQCNKVYSYNESSDNLSEHNVKRYSSHLNNLELKYIRDGNYSDTMAYSDFDGNAAFNIDDPIGKSINYETTCKNITDIRNAGDFYNDNKTYVQDVQGGGEDIFNSNSSNRINEIRQMNLPCGDSNASVIESGTTSRRLNKINLVHHRTSSKVPSNNYLSVIKNPEQEFFTIYNSVNLNTATSLPTNNNVNFNNSRRYFKSQSNLNLTSFEKKTNPTPVHAKAKSYAKPYAEMPPNMSNKMMLNNEKLYAKSSSKLYTISSDAPKVLCDYDQNRKSGIRKQNPGQLSVPASKSSLQFYIPPTEEISSGDKDTKFEINNLFKC